MKLLSFLMSLVMLMISSPAYTMEGEEVMKKALQAFYYQGHDQSAKAHMEITDKQGRKRIRDFVSLRLNLGEKDGKQKYYVYFNKPVDVKKMVFMVWKNIEQDDDRWLYLPALDLVKRIAASDDRTSFVGSNFFYEDVSGRGLAEDSHELIDETDQYYILNSTPKNPENVEFTRYKIWIDKNSFIPMKIDYYDKDFIYRHYETLEMSNIDGYMTVLKAKMEDKRTGGKTVISYSSVKYQQNIPDKIFSERYLRKVPKKYF